MNLESIFQGKSFQDFAQRWAADPVAGDKEIHQLIISQVGTVPMPHQNVYKECGTAFWRPQTCGNRDRLEKEFYDALAVYSEKYYSTRSAILDKVLTVLKSMPGEVLRPLFDRGEKAILAQINSINAEMQKAGITEVVVMAGLSSVPVMSQVLQVFSLFRKDLPVDRTLCGRLFPPPFDIVRDSNKFTAGMTKYVTFQVTSIVDEVKAEYLYILEDIFPERKLTNPDTIKRLINFNPITAIGLGLVLILLVMAWKKSQT
jgi:hypothetical protein